MSEALPDPLTPADCDLRTFSYMGLDVVKLRDSRMAAAPDGVFRAAILSYCVAWHQVPAASLPDDDAEICRLIGMGREVGRFNRLRAAGALHGFVKCSDGRLYHPLVAEKAKQAWAIKLCQKDRTEAARQARLAKRVTDLNQQHPPMRSQYSAPFLDGLTQVSPSVTDNLAQVRHSVTDDLTHVSPSVAEDLTQVRRSVTDAFTYPKDRRGEEIEEVIERNVGSQASVPVEAFGRAHKLNEKPGQETINSPDFSAWFAAFPKKENAKAASTVYAAARAKGVSAAALLAGAQRYAAEMAASKQEMRFVKMPKTWLMAEGWKDGVDAVRVAPRTQDPSWQGVDVGKWKDLFTQPVFDAWFANAEIIPDSDPPILRFPRPFQMRWVGNHFARQLRVLLGGDYQLVMRE